MTGSHDNGASTNGPSGRRLPSSPSHTLSGVERIGGITQTGTGSPTGSPSHTSRDDKPLKEQWVSYCLGFTNNEILVAVTFTSSM